MSHYPAALILALTASVPALAVDGQYDSTFHTSGHTYTDNGSGGAAMWALAPDDRLVYAQEGIGDSLDWGRVTDSTWGTPCNTPLPTGFGPVAVVDGVAFDDAGRLLVSGVVNSPLYPDFLPGFIVRFNYPSCAVDTTFSIDGWAFLVGAPLDQFGLASIAVAPSRVYAIGVQGPHTAVARFTDAGVLDTFFAGDGLWLAETAGGGGSGGIVLPNQDLAIVGKELDPLAGQVAAVTQLSAFGTLLTTVVIDPQPDQVDGAVAYNAALMGDGRLALAITDTLAGVDTPVAAVLRQQGIGNLLVLDTSYSGDGIAMANVGTSARAFDVAAQGDGKLLLGGTRLVTPSDYDALVLRLDRSGALDPAFNPILLTSYGYKVVSFPTAASDNVGTSVFLTRSGHPILGGFVTDGYPGVARLTNAYAFADGFESGKDASWSTSVP